MTRADRLRRLRRTANDLIQSLFLSVFWEMFSDIIIKSSKFKFGDILDIPLMNGAFEYNENYGKGIPVIWVDDLYYFTPINLRLLRRARLETVRAEKYQVIQDDLLFTRSSLVKEGVGQINIVPKLNEVTTFECHIIRARVNKQICNPYYLLGLYRSKFGREQILKRSKTATMTTIGQNDLMDLPCPLPKITKQNEFESFVKIVV